MSTQIPAKAPKARKITQQLEVFKKKKESQGICIPVSLWGSEEWLNKSENFLEEWKTWTQQNQDFERGRWWYFCNEGAKFTTGPTKVVSSGKERVCKSLAEVVDVVAQEKAAAGFRIEDDELSEHDLNLRYNNATS